MSDETTHEGAYDRRIRMVIGYICSHLQDELSVDHLSEVAGFSKYHFHRQFSNYTGFAVADFVRQLRLKRASHQLVFEPQRRIIDIAFEAGFSAPESFSRAFKEAHGQTPSEFRRTPRWQALSHDQPLPTPTRNNSMTPDLVQFETTRVAVLEHRGPVTHLMASVARFVEWRKAEPDASGVQRRVFGIAYDDPQKTEPEAFRFDICAEIDQPLRANATGIIEKTIPGGRCAVARHIGSTDAIGETVHALYAKWLPQSGEQLREFPCFFQYIKRVPTVLEHEQVTDVYLPIY
jgi:AraC family transcriptional regulator